VGVFLNLSQDHLERHPSLEAYRDAKLRLFARQGAGDTAVLNADDPALAEAAVPARRVFFSLEGPADAWLDGSQLRLGGEPILPAAELGISGRHNVANALAAVLAARELGVDAATAAGVLRDFRGLPHRHRTVLEAGGVRWVDDSKATNVGATLAALGGYPDCSVHLILGGLGKGQDVRRAGRRRGAGGPPPST
jgi:UDP-N-acetylmuramoylalanine-D-glutamate ligase